MLRGKKRDYLREISHQRSGQKFPPNPKNIDFLDRPNLNPPTLPLNSLSPAPNLPNSKKTPRKFAETLTMKSRSHRLPPSDPPDDWANGSWTVDCSCGVTFDDGEEMVSCDECGVWVHTRCSRFVKGEPNFACHNCKKNQNKAIDTEETEVAQLLIELPTKTDPSLPGPTTYRAPFRLWAEVPMEDRVHVQGVPGGDSSLFQGISSSVFTSELWRCSGYVPKKFNFQYREFSAWEEDGGENMASRGADVLFSLSKEIVPSQVPVRSFERKQENEKGLLGSRLQSWGKKERNKIRIFGAHSSKRREEMGEGNEKDQSGKKKKVRSHADRVVAEFKKRVSVTLANIEKTGLSEDGGLQVAESDVPSVKSEERKEDAPSLHNSSDQVEGTDCGNQVAKMDVDNKPKHVLVIKASKGGSTEGVPRQKNASKVFVKVEVEDGNAGTSSEANASSAFQEKQDGDDDDVKESVKEEDLSKTVHDLRQSKDDLRQSKDECDFQGDPNGSEQAKLLTSGLCHRKEKMKQPVQQPPSEPFNHPTSMHPPTSASDVNTSSDQQESSEAVNCLKQSKDESHIQGVLNNSTQAKLVSSASSQKNEKLSVPQPPSKRHSHSTSMHRPTSASTTSILSDEELALLLHQELNSSPRVPRVPRMRQASGVQLASQSAPSMLSKRSSHSAGKDQVFRRKNKEETARDGSRNSQESTDETRKAGRAMSSHDRRCRESSFITDGSSKKTLRHRSPDTAVSLKNTSCASTESAKICQSLFETRRHNASSMKSFPRDVPDDDTTPHTLPGLINEILSKQKCSSYEELCDAVRPHWHNVRKPNGDRYAYSSHSHAVLDCLRNRSEWAHLIDRGPKTNSCKKRRKTEDTPTMEETENEEAKRRTSSRELEDKSGDSHREDYPKGKRKARKRRMLEVRGQGEEFRKRKRATSSGSAIISEDDDSDNDDESAAAFSNSSNKGADGGFSEDESHGAVECAVRTDASASTSSASSR